jgi:hypothetical protein
MKTWFYKELGDAMMAAQPANQIREAFLPLFVSAGNPEDMAVFTRNDSEGRLHCEVSVYFSPAAIDIAKAFDAKPCEIPLKEGLDLLVGSQNSWFALFPENKK